MSFHIKDKVIILDEFQGNEECIDKVGIIVTINEGYEEEDDYEEDGDILVRFKKRYCSELHNGDGSTSDDNCWWYPARCLKRIRVDDNSNIMLKGGQ